MNTGGFPVQTGTGTFSHRGGSGRSAAPGAFGCAPGTDPASGKSGSTTSTHTYKPAGNGTMVPEFIRQGYMCMNKKMIQFLEKPLEFLDSLSSAWQFPLLG